jgi:hypothetical protein
MHPLWLDLDVAIRRCPHCRDECPAGRLVYLTVGFLILI